MLYLKTANDLKSTLSLKNFALELTHLISTDSAIWNYYQLWFRFNNWKMHENIERL